MYECSSYSPGVYPGRTDYRIIPWNISHCFFFAVFIFLLSTVSGLSQDILQINFTKGAEYSKLIDFNGSIGEKPNNVIVSEDYIYGSCLLGGSENAGVLYKIKADGSGLQVVEFGALYGRPVSIFLSNNIIYGTTIQGGSEDEGVIFKINTNLDDGLNDIASHVITSFALGYEYPVYEHIIVKDNLIYLFIYDDLDPQSGYIIQMNDDGTDIRFLAHMSQCYGGDMVLLDNDLYCVILNSSGGGIIIRLETDTQEWSALHSFASGEYPDHLVLSGTTIYGITQHGGSYNASTLFSLNINGTGFKELFEFPNEGIKEAFGDSISDLEISQSCLYGTRYYGGAAELGSLFKINTDGSGYKILHEFQNHNNGTLPGDIAVANDTIYGTAYGGIYSMKGVLYKVNQIPDNPSIPLLNIELPIKAPEHIIVNTQDNLEVLKDSFIDLDTSFSVVGNIDYTHLWEIKTDTGYDVINNTAEIITDTTFYLFITTAEGCSYLDSTIINVKYAEGNTNAENGKDIYIYPNPVNNFLTIKANKYDHYLFKITSMNGQLIYNGEMEGASKQINFSTFPKGVYLFTIWSKEFVRTEKIIKY